MLRTSSGLRNFSLSAIDGEIGSVEDFYFDDQAWGIRYLEVDTGKWLPGRKVLISPFSIAKVLSDRKSIAVKLTREQVERSPDIDTHQPISRQQETEFFDYYRYPYYWSGPFLWGPVAAPYLAGLPAEANKGTMATEIEAVKKREHAQDRHLRSTQEVTGYRIQAVDGEIGHVEDFLLEDESWAIRYMVVDTRNWLPGRKVVVSPEWIDAVSWEESKVYVDLPRDKIEHAPEYDPAAPLGRDYESRIHAHYGRSGYWSQQESRHE